MYLNPIRNHFSALFFSHISMIGSLEQIKFKDDTQIREKEVCWESEETIFDLNNLKKKTC